MPSPPIPPWQQVPRHLRLSYWELGEEHKARRRSALEQEAEGLAADPAAAIMGYSRLPDAFGGRLVNGDLAATLLPTLAANPTQGYEALEDSECRAVVSMNQVGKLLRDRALDLAARDPVLILMGGQATGKTTGALALGHTFGAILDAPHTDPDAMRFLIRRVRPMGNEVHVAYTDRTPAGALRAMLDRSEREGRYVPLDRMARTHAQAPYTFLNLGSQIGRDLVLYHIQADEGEGSRMAEGREALEQISRRPKPAARELANRLQGAYLTLLRTQTDDPQAWYSRDVLAGLNRSLDPWRRGEADRLLRRICQAMAQRSPEGGPGAPAGKP
ncbi:MAG: hypothetical protein HY823_00045 [Acidobacteria bacterium]|nr:hypothetical protein [Acidobacteriota bacterium]